MVNKLETNLTPNEVEVEGMSTPEEAMEFAQRAVDHISEELAEDQKFPGAKAYNRVMEAIVKAGASGNLIEKWQEGYEELEEKWQEVKSKEDFVADLKEKLQDALDSLAESEEEAEELE